MTDRSATLDDATMKAGLLMESAQAHQKLAENQLERLRAHTRDLDGVVRDEIRRTLVQELRELATETTRASQVLRKIRVGGNLRGAAWSLAAAVLCMGGVLGVERWACPTASELASLRARRDGLAENLAKLEHEGGHIDWRRCGEARRLCVRVDRKAPTYGEKGDYFVIEGY